MTDNTNNSKITDAAAKAIQDAAKATNTKTAPAVVETIGAAGALAGDTVKTATRILTKPVRMFAGAGDKGGNLIKSTAKGLDNVASRGANIATGVMKNPVTKPLLMVAAAVFVYKWAKNKLSNNKQKTANQAKAEQLEAIEAQNAQMTNDYRAYQFDNSQAKGGHQARYNSQQVGGHYQGR